MILYCFRFPVRLSWSASPRWFVASPKIRPSRRVSFPRQLSDPLLPCLPRSSVLRLASSCAPALSLFSPSELPFLASVFSCYCSHSLNSSFSNSLMPLSPSFTLFYNSLSLLIFSYTFPLHILSLRPSPSPCVPPLLCPLFHFPLSFLLVSLTFPLSLLLSPPSLRLSAPCLTALLVSCSLLAQWSSFFSVTFRFSFFFVTVFWVCVLSLYFVPLLLSLCSLFSVCSFFVCVLFVLFSTICLSV